MPGEAAGRRRTAAAQPRTAHSPETMAPRKGNRPYHENLAANSPEWRRKPLMDAGSRDSVVMYPEITGIGNAS
jgi:hypothetical protein